MVSLTFDEFHAIRSRQRAAAGAKLRSKQAKPEKENENENQRQGTSSRKGVVASPPPRRSVAVVPDDPGQGTTTTNTTTIKGTISDTVGEEEEEEEEVAPLSGSTHLRPPKRNTIPATEKPRKNSTYIVDEAKTKRGDDDDVLVSELRRGYNRKGSGIWGTLSSASSLGRFVELFEVQMAVVIVIYVDFIVSTVQLLPCMQAEALAGGKEGGDGRSAGPWVVRLVARLMESLTGFTTVLFVVELVLLIAAFRLRFFRHLGYVVDMLVVSASFCQDLAGLGKGVKLLGALRVWRVARVVNTLLESADEAHEETRSTLRVAEKRSRDLDTDRKRLQETLQREVETRKRVDKMLQGYKDEVETLNEALKIAAMDITNNAGVSAKTDRHYQGIGESAGKRSSAESDDNTAAAVDASGSTRSARAGEASGSEAGVATGREGRTWPGSPSSASTSSSSTTSTTRRGGAGGPGRIFVLRDGTFQTQNDC